MAQTNAELTKFLYFIFLKSPTYTFNDSVLVCTLNYLQFTFRLAKIKKTKRVIKFDMH